jgi:Family of unknown function (DUF6454)
MRWILLSWLAAALGQHAPVRTIELKGKTYHVQGIDLDTTRLWVTSVDKEAKKGYLHEFALPSGELGRTVEVGAGERFHAGGIAREGESLWLPVAEYRRESSAIIQRRNAKTLELEMQFEVADHIGCVAAGPDFVVGGNWDSRLFYVWDMKGKLLRKIENATGNGYQDLKFVDGKLVGGGLLPSKAGAVDWLEWPSLRLEKRVRVGRTDRGVAYTNEGMAVRGDRVFLLPEDGPSRLFEFRFGRP